jgi:ppGpp synthetase/RelA/SpoT-type nucleotidyltranferase
MESRLTALYSLHREVQAAIHDASIHSPASGSSNLKTNFCSKIWPFLKPKYGEFVDGIVRYCKEELQIRNLNCMVLGRVKTAESVQKSLDRREEHRQRPCIGLEDILKTMHDLVGSMVVLQYPSDVPKVNMFIAQSFRAIQQPTHWSRDRQPGLHWDSRFGSYESYNHHVTLQGESDHPALGPGVIFEIQVTTCGDYMYNRLAHDWYYKKSHGPLSRKDEIVLDMIHTAAIMVEVGGEYMKEREHENDENRDKAGPEYDLSQVFQHAQGAEEWRVKPANLPPILRALEEKGYISASKLEHLAKNLAKNLGPLKEEGTSGHDPIAQLLEIIAQKSKRHFLVPFGQNEGFIGREKTVNWLLEKITPSTRPNDCQRTAIEGLGGTGKTQIALEAAYRVRNRHPECSVFWVPAISITTFDNAYREIGDALQVPGIQDDKVEIKALVKRALNQESRGEWLLIIDKLDDIELVTDLADFLPSNPKGSILFTTRNHTVITRLDIAPGRVERVGEMSRDEALEMLKRNTKESQWQDTANTPKLLDFLADLPLAIRQASAYIWQNDITTAKYLSYCQSSDEKDIIMLSKDFEDRCRYRDIRNPVATTWPISFTHISRDKLLAARYLRFMCFLAEKDIPESLLPFAEDEIERDEAIAALQAYAFITKREDDTAFDIHRLVRLAMRNHLKGEDTTESVTMMVQHLCEIYPFPEYENRDIWMRYMPHLLTAAEVHEESADKYATGMLLAKVASLTYAITAKYKKAEEVYRQVLELCEEMLGRQHPLMFRYGV